MAAMRMPDTVRYDTSLVVLSVVIAVVAGTAALWAALRLATVGATLVASLIMGVAVSGMHYTGIAAMHVYGTQNPGMLAGMSGGVSAQAFLLPLIVGISLLAFALTVIISLSPTEAEMREDAALMAHLAGRPAAPPVGTPRAPGPADAPGQYGAGQYAPGQYGPGQPGPGQYRPEQYGPGPAGPGSYGRRAEPDDPEAGRWFRPQGLFSPAARRAARGRFAPGPRSLVCKRA
jgi:Bacterial signalling protein N terminal repeat